mmetsp:Transcript_85005/g.240888  ORF Transcript_85005/g.240888 Transcript_85005/m.240888 type:complete len:559 (-) Transcript_85005:136-1812(-)
MATPAAAALRLTPTQQQALQEILVSAGMRVAPLVELRSPPMLGRGHGVTTVMRAAAAALGAPLLGIATALEGTCPGERKEMPGLMDLEPARTIRAAALKSLEEHGVAVIDDLDLSVCPRHLKRSRTLVGEIKNAGQMWNWDVLTQPALLLKSLADQAAAEGKVIVYASMEDNFQAFLQEPFTVMLGEPTEADYAAVLGNRLGTEVAAKLDMASLRALHSQLAPAELLTAVARAAVKSAAAHGLGGKPEAASLAACAPDSPALLASVRETIMGGSAVRPEDVEPVDLDRFPGLGGIKEELEKFVLFPLEHPDLAAELGLQPKRGVLVHGEPGTGKTTVGRWLAHRMKGKFFRVGEMMVHSDIIRVFAAAQAAAPSVVFIDDADIVIGGWRPIDGGRGSDIFRFLLGQMDGLMSRGERQKQNGDVIVILTAQNVQWMAKMLLRSGRIELWLKTKLPEPKVKREVLKKYVTEDAGAMKLLGDKEVPPDVRPASQAGDQYCCADLRRIVNDAKVLAAWDKHGAATQAPEKAPQEGAKYLESAAKAVTDMQQEVDAITRNMYG